MDDAIPTAKNDRMSGVVFEGQNSEFPLNSSPCHRISRAKVLEFWTSGGLPDFAPRKNAKIDRAASRVEQVLFGALGEMLGLALPFALPCWALHVR